MKYDDIITFDRPISTRHKPMSLEKRAAQFAPFAALTGYEALAAETARLTDAKTELAEDKKELMNEIFRQVLLLEKHPPVRVEYFVEDRKKSGGAYHTISGRIKKVDTVEGKLTMMDGLEISLGSVRHVCSPLIPDVMNWL